MLSPDMSRSLATVALALTLLAGCATPPQAQVDEPSPEIVTYSSVQQWLNLQQEVASMSTEEVVAKLMRENKPEAVGQLFYYGLLNQQLQTFDAWTQARDTFRQLHENKKVGVEQRQLAGILQEYNQNRINWYQRQRELLIRHAELKQQLSEAEQDKLLLEQKIQALTDLEAAISTRKER
jgi:outer membrane murein-binding lipoprotein Lpp